MTQISSPDGAPKLLHNAHGVIDRADGNSDEHGEDEAVEEVAERVWFFVGDGENVGQEGRDALVHRALALVPKGLADAFSATEVLGEADPRVQSLLAAVYGPPGG